MQKPTVQEFIDQNMPYLLRDVLSYLNSNGGNLYIFLDERNSKDEDFSLLKQFKEIIPIEIVPTCSSYLEFFLKEDSNYKWIEIVIQPGIFKPYYLKKAGLKPNKTFVRQKHKAVPISDTEIKKLIEESAPNSFESQRSLQTEFSFSSLEEYFKSRNLTFKQEDYSRLHILGQDKHYSELASLLSDSYPYQTHIFTFISSSSYLMKDHYLFSGSLIKQYYDALDCIQTITGSRCFYYHGRKARAQDYPLVALREALTNALVHRDYKYNKSTLIKIFKDRIEIENPIFSTQDHSISDLKSAPLNPKLFSVLENCFFVLGKGEGQNLINKAYKNFSVKPEVKADDNYFTTILPNVNYTYQDYTEEVASILIKEKFEEDNKKEFLFRSALRKEFLKLEDISFILNQPIEEAELTLRQLLKENFLVPDKNEHEKRYRLGPNGFPEDY